MEVVAERSMISMLLRKDPLVRPVATKSLVKPIEFSNFVFPLSHNFPDSNFFTSTMNPWLSTSLEFLSFFE